jgi:hypothetical protein
MVDDEYKVKYKITYRSPGCTDDEILDHLCNDEIVDDFFSHHISIRNGKIVFIGSYSGSEIDQLAKLSTQCLLCTTAFYERFSSNTTERAKQLCKAHYDSDVVVTREMVKRRRKDIKKLKRVLYEKKHNIHFPETLTLSPIDHEPGDEKYHTVKLQLIRVKTFE